MNKQRYRIGIDLGGTYIKAGVIDEEGRILAKTKIETKADKPWQEVIERIAYVIKQVQKDACLESDSEIFVGVGCPGTIDDKTGTVLYSNNIAWENVPIADMLSKQCGYDVKVANDADCATMGEFYAGAAKSHDSVVLLTLGTGIGSGVILNGKLLAGTELGHRMLKKDGDLCSCGRRGCLEAYLSSSALLSKMMEKRKTVVTTGVRSIFEEAKQGDAVANEIVTNYVDALADGIADVIHSYWPDQILLGGGISESDDLLLPALNRLVPERVFGKSQYKHCEISKAMLGNDAGWIGAAWLASEKTTGDKR